MNKPPFKNAPGWLYGIALILVAFVLGIALLWRFAPKVLFLW